jgi:hypothetical protein
MKFPAIGFSEEDLNSKLHDDDTGVCMHAHMLMCTHTHTNLKTQAYFTFPVPIKYPGFLYPKSGCPEQS